MRAKPSPLCLLSLRQQAGDVKLHPVQMRSPGFTEIARIHQLKQHGRIIGTQFRGVMLDDDMRAGPVVIQAQFDLLISRAFRQGKLRQYIKNAVKRRGRNPSWRIVDFTVLKSYPFLREAVQSIGQPVFDKPIQEHGLGLKIL